jgi:hypothetical protein
MPQRSTGSRVYLTLVGFALALVGGVFAALMWRSFQRARVVDSWPVVPCIILRSDVEERQIDPNSAVERRFAVLYGYEWQGAPLESQLLKLRGSMWSSKPAGADALLERYPEGSRQQCRVNPADPTIAVLEPESKAPGYSLWFPLLFVVGGLGVMGGAWRK